MDIKVNEDRCTNISTIEAGYEYENLAYKINFKFPDYLNQFNKLIEFEYGDTKTYDALLNDEYIFKDNITRYSIVACQIVFTKSVGDEEVQVYKTNIFYVKFGNSINADKEIDPSDENINVLNTLISEVNSLKNELTLTIEEVNKNEEIRNEKVDTAIATIKDLTDEYNTNAENKTNEFNSNAQEKTDILNEIADGVKDFATAIQFATFEVDISDMNLYINTADKLKNTAFSLNEETGELEVEIING